MYDGFISSAHPLSSPLLSSCCISKWHSLSERIRTSFSDLLAGLSTRLKLLVPGDELVWQLLE